jgi:hypothetical protein
MPHVLYYFHDDLEESHPNAFEVSLETREPRVE